LSEASIWENLAGPFSQDEVKLTLIDFFDWRDFRYRLSTQFGSASDHCAGRGFG
jgi:hypothetical protein